jgi:hypothetical protein
MTWRNPVNGRIALYIASHAYAVEGLGDAEARALLDELMAEATRPEFTYLHHWRPGDVLMWDNRATMHRGRPWPFMYAKKEDYRQATQSVWFGGASPSAVILPAVP